MIFYSLEESLEYYEDENEKDHRIAQLNIPEDILLENLFYFWKIVANACLKKKDEA